MGNFGVNVYENLKFEGRYTGRKSAKNNDGQETPLLEAQIERSFQSFLSKKCDFRFKNMKNPNMTSKVLYELLIRSYERFKYFSQA